MVVNNIVSAVLDPEQAGQEDRSWVFPSPVRPVRVREHGKVIMLPVQLQDSPPWARKLALGLGGFFLAKLAGAPSSLRGLGKSAYSLCKQRRTSVSMSRVFSGLPPVQPAPRTPSLAATLQPRPA